MVNFFYCHSLKFALCCFHSDGTGRTGTYILIDMVLNRMAKGDVLSIWQQNIYHESLCEVNIEWDWQTQY